MNSSQPPQNIPDVEELRKQSPDDLPFLAESIRNYIIDIVSVNPGHLGASLGTVELAIALHYVFNTPEDKLIWDVGHQAYAHKILTGRKKDFKQMRKIGGISGFPKMDESEYDAFGTGHASTSISALCGLAESARLDGNHSRQHIAVIGDGSMTGGLAFEGLNNASVSKTNMLIIFNDNGISIDQNVGGLKEAFIGMASNRSFNRLRNAIWKMLGGSKNQGRAIRRFVRQINLAVKGYLLKKSNFFEALQFRYFGPVDGHDIKRLIKVLNELKEIQGPKVLHIITKKGKGLAPAEVYQTKYHSPGKFDKETGLIVETKKTDRPPRYQDVFGETMLELAALDERIIGITPAMPTGSSLNLMMQKYPERAFDVGIAEGHALTFAAGLAADGKIPYCTIYSTFMQRAFDQLIHDVALQKLHMVLCIDRAGLVGEDGATHHGVFDLAFFNCIPHVHIASPINETEFRNMMYSAREPHQGPYIIRYPRGRGKHLDWKKPIQLIKTGTASCILEGNEIAVLSIGPIGETALEVIGEMPQAKNRVALYNMRFLKPIDIHMIQHIFKRFRYILTIEDGVLIGGLGSTLNRLKNDWGYQGKIINLGVPDQFIEHGSVKELHALCGFDRNGIRTAIESLLSTAELE